MLKIFFLIIIFSLFCAFYVAVYERKSRPLQYIDVNLTLNNQPIASLSDVEKRQVYDQCKSFSQKSRLLGPLQRNSRNGELFFPDENTALQDVYLLLRYAPRKEDEGALYLQLATSYLLSKNLQRLPIRQQARTRAAVFLSEKYDSTMYKRLKEWFQSIYAPYTNVTHFIRTKPGNQASWEYMMNYTKHIKEIKPDTILFLLEDDYIYEADMLYDTIEFFASHNPCFVHQTDYPDRYRMNINDDDGHITVVAGKTRLWRSITSTTVSYACRFRTFLALEDIIMHPNSDWGASHNVRARVGNAAFFSAIPSHGAHTETLLLLNEKNAYSKIEYSAYYKDWWLFARHALFEAQKKSNFPAPKMSKQSLFSK
jgi:hypothetical protein